MNRMNAEHREEVDSDLLQDNLLWHPASCKIRALVVNGDHAGKNVAFAPPIEVIRRRDCVVWIRWASLGICLPHHYEARWVGIRKRLQQCGIDDREDCRICADAESQRENRDRRKGGIFAQYSRPVAN